MEIYSKIDSDRFGIKVGKITESFFNNNTVENSINYFKENKFDLIFARINYNRLDVINGLERYGFTLKDTQYTLRHNLLDIEKYPERTDEYTIREFQSSDTEMIVEIAKISFDYYGHYATDKRLNRQDCLDAYINWTYNCCINQNVATKIFVADKNGEIAGYIAYKEFLENDEKYAAGVIGAVSPKHRGKGLFPDIDVAGFKWGVANNFVWEEHNVLCDNIAVFKSHLKVGFKPNKFMVTLHGWMDEIKI